MQVYTKILIGMVVGAVVGIFLGPNSSFLPADIYRVEALESLHVRMDADREDSVVPFDRLLGVTRHRVRQLSIVQSRYEMKEDALGKKIKVPSWVEVLFPYDQKLSLRDPDKIIKKAMGNPDVGQSVSVWLRVRTEPLSEGGFAQFPRPVSGIGEHVVTFVRPVGTIFMSMLKMTIVPLVFSSLLVGVASLGDVRRLGRLGGRTLGLYMVTTAIAVSIGLIVANIVSPGNYVAEADRVFLQGQYAGAAGSKAGMAADAPSPMDNILSIIPENPIDALASGNMLQVIFFALMLGIAITLLEKGKGSPIVAFFDRLQNAMIMIIHMVMAIAPFGVAALVADVVGQSGVSVLSALLVYSLAVVIGLLIHGGLVYGMIVKLFTKVPVLRFMGAIRPAQLIAFSTSSSSATLPVSMKCAEENLGVSNPVASFVLPLGATVNMDGTALYQGVAAVFIAQVFQIDLSVMDQLGIVATATLASIGTAGVPGASIVMIALVLTTAGIPTDGLALILGVDRFLDMARSSINVTGDLAVTAAMAAQEGETVQVREKTVVPSGSSEGDSGSDVDSSVS